MVARLSYNFRNMRKLLTIIILIMLFINANAQNNIKFQSTCYNFNTIDVAKTGKSVSCYFTFTNTGSSAVTINSVSVSSGYIQVDYPKTPILPNQQGRIAVKYNMELDINTMLQNNKLTYMFKKPISVRFSSSKSITRLFISGTIKAAIPEKQKMTGNDGFVWYKTFSNDKFGAKDITGNSIVPTNYSDISYYISESDFPARGFLVHKDDNVGFYDVKGKCIIPTQRGYKKFIRKSSSKEFGTYYVFMKNDCVCFCDCDGNEILSLPFNVLDLTDLNYNFIPYYTEGKFFVKYTYSFRDFESLFIKNGIIDGNGNIVLKCDGLVTLDVKKGNFEYYSDSQGKTVICEKKLSDIKTTKNPFAGNRLEDD